MLEELDLWRELLDGRGALPRSWAGRLRRDLEIDAVAASTSMEGIPVTVEEVRQILSGTRPSTVSENDAELVRGYRDSMALALRRSDDPLFRWTPEVFLSLHDRVLAGRFDLSAGRIRSGVAFLADRATGERIFEAAPPQNVLGRLEQVCQSVSDTKHHPAELAAWLHIAIAGIHPFRDGNGRTARIVASLAMLRGGFKLPEFTSLEEWWGRHLGDYYASFKCLGQTFDPKVNVTDFMVAHVGAQLKQVRALDLREQVQRAVWTAIEDVLTLRSMPTRIANALWEAFFGRSVSSKYYRSLSDVSPATAANDLATCAATGLLAPQGGGRSRAYTCGNVLMPDIGRSLGLEVVGTDEQARSMITATVGKRIASSDIRAQLRARR